MLLPYTQARKVGERYYLGGPCKHGHAEGKRFVKDGYCYRCYKKKKNRREMRRRGTPEGRARRNAKLRLQRKTWTIQQRMLDNIRQRTRRAFCGEMSRQSTIKMLGCSLEFLRAHFEAQWSPGMSWENYGGGADKWNVDHRRPLASFDLTDPEQLAAATHYTNLQPMWAMENYLKGATYDGSLLKNLGPKN